MAGGQDFALLIVAFGQQRHRAVGAGDGQADRVDPLDLAQAIEEVTAGQDRPGVTAAHRVPRLPFFLLLDRDNEPLDPGTERSRFALSHCLAFLVVHGGLTRVTIDVFPRQDVAQVGGHIAQEPVLAGQDDLRALVGVRDFLAVRIIGAFAG